MRGTYRVRDLYPGSTGSYPQELTRVGNALYFVAAYPGSHRELYRSDGTESGTALVFDIEPVPAGGPNVTHLTAVGTTLYFIATDVAHGE